MKSLLGSKDESVKRRRVKKIKRAQIEIVDCVLVKIWFEFVLLRIELNFGDLNGENVDDGVEELKFCCSSGKKTKKIPIARAPAPPPWSS